MRSLKAIYEGNIKEAKKVHARTTKEVMRIENSIKASNQQKEDSVRYFISKEEKDC